MNKCRWNLNIPPAFIVHIVQTNVISESCHYFLFDNTGYLFNASTIAALKAGRSLGVRLEIN